MKKYIVKFNDENKNGYEVTAGDYHTFETVFNSQKCWLSKGGKMFITNELGETKVFIKG